MIFSQAYRQTPAITNAQIAPALVRLEDDLMAIPQADRTPRVLFLFDVRRSYLTNLALSRANEAIAQRRAAGLEFQPSAEMAAAFARGN